MRRRLSCTGWRLGAMLMASVVGCGQRHEPVRAAAPSPDELPDLARVERIYPARIGIAGEDHRAPRASLLPDLSEPRFTPEQRAFLADQKAADEPEYDVLAFYKPPLGTEQGVVPIDAGTRYGMAGVGGAMVGYCPVVITIHVQDGTPAAYGEALLPVRPARAYGATRPLAGQGPEGRIHVGQNPPRRTAGKHARVED
jgi:hypothetical protein